MAQIIKRKGMWYSDFRQNGKRIRRALSPYKEKAEELLADLLQIRSSEKGGTFPQSASWFYFKERYLTSRKARMNPSTYNNDERIFAMLEKYGRPLLRTNQMTPEYLDDFWIKAKTHKTEPLSDRTISGYVRRIKTAMYQARIWELAPLQEWKLVKCLADEKREEYLSYPDFVRVLEACEGPFQRAAMLMGWAGLRRGEVLHLEWSDIDFKSRQIYVRIKDAKSAGGAWAPKGSKPGKPKNRVVAMTKKLEAYLQASPNQTGLVLGKVIDEDNFSKYFRELGDELGLHLFPHKFRHTCASFLVSTGVSLKQIGELFGQKDARSTAVYTHMIPEALHGAMDQMQNGMDAMGHNGNDIAPAGM